MRNQISLFNVLVNNVWYFEDDVLGGGSSSYEQYEEFKDCFPQVERALFYANNDFFSGTQNRIGINMQAAPAAFRKELQSGERTSNLNTDIILQVLFTTPMTARVDSFLCASVTVSLPRIGGSKIGVLRETGKKNKINPILIFFLLRVLCYKEKKSQKPSVEK